jgi:hypothetical protein
MERLIVMFALLLSACFAWPCESVGQSTATMSVDKVTTGTVRQQQWLAATLNERVRLAEAIGDEGARAMAKAKAHEVIFDGSVRTLSLGPDQVYRGSDGRVIVYEAKGGTSQLGRGYGYPQGTSEWAVESAKEVLKSAKSSTGEQRGAKAILEAAAKGQLEVHVIRTKHVLGEPTAAILEQTMRCSDDATRLARIALDDIARTSAIVIESTDDVAHVVAKSAKVGKSVAKVAVPAAFVVDGGIRVYEGVETEKRFAAGEITSQQREVSHAKNTAGMAGGFAGAWAGAQLGAMGGSAAGTVVAPGPGTAIGATFGCFAGGVAGYFGGERAATAAAEKAMNKVHAAGTTVSEKTRSAVGGAKQAWNWVWSK